MNLYCVCECHGTHVEARGQFAGISSSLSSCGFQRLNSGCQAWLQSPSPTEPSHWPSRFYNSVLRSSGARCQCKQWNSCDEPGHSDIRKRLIQFVVFQMLEVTTDGLSPEAHQQLHSKKQSFVWEL